MDHKRQQYNATFVNYTKYYKGIVRSLDLNFVELRHAHYKAEQIRQAQYLSDIAAVQLAVHSAMPGPVKRERCEKPVSEFVHEPKPDNTVLSPVLEPTAKRTNRKPKGSGIAHNRTGLDGLRDCENPNCTAKGVKVYWSDCGENGVFDLCQTCHGYANRTGRMRSKGLILKADIRRKIGDISERNSKIRELRRKSGSSWKKSTTDFLLRCENPSCGRKTQTLTLMHARGYCSLRVCAVCRDGGPAPKLIAGDVCSGQDCDVVMTDMNCRSYMGKNYCPPCAHHLFKKNGLFGPSSERLIRQWQEGADEGCEPKERIC